MTLLGACTEGPPSLEVDLRTDYLPAVDFAEVEVGIEGVPTEAVHRVSPGADYLRGVRVAELDDIPLGGIVVRATLHNSQEARIVERRVALIAREGVNRVTIVITRNCELVSCPPADNPTATECLGERCVEPFCLEDTVGGCTEGCGSDADCTQPSAPCARASCEGGTCFVTGDRTACGVGEVCHPTFGCVPEFDGRDGGPGGCGSACDTGNPCERGVVDCSLGTAACVAQGPIAAGAECGPELAGGWSECSGFAHDCAPKGTQTRTVVRNICDGAGSCESFTETETSECDRDADGMSCGIGTVHGSYGSCETPTVCALQGQRTRTVTTHRCVSEACVAATSLESEECQVDTDQLECKNPEETVGACGPGAAIRPCSSNGVRQRTTRFFHCVSGLCKLRNRDTSNEMCTYDPTGDSCPNANAPLYPCETWLCAGAYVCMAAGDTCGAGEMCCPSGCKSNVSCIAVE